MANEAREVGVGRAAAATLVALALLATGCSEYYLGAPSLTLVSTADGSAFYEPVGPVRTGSACRGNYLFVFGSGDVPSHEAAIARLLEETGADVLVNARLTRERVSLLLYSVDCATVKGQPARLVSRSDGVEPAP